MFAILLIFFDLSSLLAMTLFLFQICVKVQKACELLNGVGA